MHAAGTGVTPSIRVIWVIYSYEFSSYTLDLSYILANVINPSSKIMHHLIVGVLPSIKSSIFVKSNPLGNYRKVIKAAKDKNSKVKVLLAVGGWNNGGKPFSDMALSKESRKIFIDSVTELLTEYEFDGFDLDWEYPVVRDGRPKDKDNFLKLIKVSSILSCCHLTMTNITVLSYKSFTPLLPRSG